MNWLLRTFIAFSVAISVSECTFSFIQVPKSPTYGVIGKELRLQWKHHCLDKRCPELYAIVFGVSGRYFIYKDLINGGLHMFPHSGANKTIDKQYEGRVSLQNNTMVISGFTKADAVTYVCKLLSYDGRKVIPSLVTVLPAVAPKFTKTPYSTSVTLSIGDSLSLDCKASGKPAPTVVWRKDGAIESQGTNSSQYTVSQVTVKNAGTYRCEATNIAGKTSWQGEVVFPVQTPTAHPRQTSTSSSTPTTDHEGNTSYTNKENSTPLGVIVGAAIGGILLLAVAIAIFLFLRKKKGRSPKDLESRHGHTHNEVPVHFSKDERQALVCDDTREEHTYEIRDQKNKETLYASAESLVSASSIPNSQMYAQVDKKNKKSKRFLGEIEYADLDLADETSPQHVPPASPTKYADIQNPDGEKVQYENLPLKIESQENMYATIKNPHQEDTYANA